ncbi:hypothetical protein HEB94_003674 [Actinopolymorpha pittospori]|uniref:Uncharacterized protein n=1 Tax=Actinopolymorpha pittospori TaxID=648752 RepID=A0A927RJ39_9ACTN|nr:hypothetical protein [Actinopolymorpha pittospori]
MTRGTADRPQRHKRHPADQGLWTTISVVSQASTKARYAHYLQYSCPKDFL